jgi:hypothetical protein
MANNRPNDRKREMNKARKLALETGLNRKKRRELARAALKPKPTETPASDAIKARGRKRTKAEKVSDTSAELVAVDTAPVTAETNA